MLDRTPPDAIGRPSSRQFEWTPKRVERLRELADMRWSARMIAGDLGTTRSSVIGKCHRFGIPLMGQDHAANGAADKLARKRISDDRRRQAAKVYSAPAKSAKKSKTFTFGFKTGMAPKLARVVPSREHERPETTEPFNGGLTLMELRSGVCRWPFGDPREPETFRFCGAPCDAARSYCECHRNVAIAKSTRVLSDAHRDAIRYASLKRHARVDEAAA